MSSTNIYYVYAYIRSIDSATAKAGTPYYIGKGKGNRAWALHENVRVPKSVENIKIVAEGLCEEDAFTLEIELIAKYGKKIDKCGGILINVLDGGDGFTSKNNPAKSEAHREKMRVANPMTVLRINKGTFKKGHTPSFTEERNEKVRQSKLSAKNVNYNNPDASKHLNENKEKCKYCEMVTSLGNLKRWHNENCKYRNHISI